MPLTSNLVIRQAYVRIGAYQGDAAQIATDYSATVADLNTESFPLQSMWDMLTLVEGEIATAVGLNVNSPYRRILADTVTVTSGGLVPGVGAGGGTIIGVWGQVRGGGSELTRGLHLDEIRAINNSPIFLSSYFSYAYAPPRFYATVGSAEIDVCTFNQAVRQAAIEADEALLFQQCEGAYFTGLMSNLKNEDPLLQGLSGQYAAPYQSWLQSLNPSPRDLVGEEAA